MIKKCLLIVVLFFFCTNVFAYNKYKKGKIVEYNGMEFYVIKYSGRNDDYIRLMKKEPLSVFEVNTYGVGHINRYTEDTVGTANNILDYGAVAYYSSETCGYYNGMQQSNGCNTSYEASDVKYIIDAWTSAKINDNDLKLSELPTIEDMIDELGYNRSVTVSGTNSLDLTPFVPSWVYNSNYTYWTMTKYQDYERLVYSVNIDGIINSKSIYSNRTVIRPVIEIYKFAFGETPDEKENREYYIGDKVTYKGINFYVIKDSSSKDDFVTLLKEYPLTTEEVNTYGGVGTDNNRINNYDDAPSAPYYYKAINNSGYGGVYWCSSKKCREEEGTHLYENSDIKYVVDAWGYDRLNAKDLKDLRLITIEELTDELGYRVVTTSGTIRSMISDNGTTPKWVYDNCGAYYWTMSPHGDSKNVLAVYKSGRINNLKSTISFEDGALSEIRPVVELYKCAIDDSCDTSGNQDIEGDSKSKDTEESSYEVRVPNTLKSVSGLIVLIGLVLVCMGLNIFMILKTKNRKKD